VSDEQESKSSELHNLRTNSLCVFVGDLLPFCWGLSPPEGGSTLAQGRFSYDYPLSHWPKRTQEGGDVYKGFVNKITAPHYKQKDAILPSCPG